jgi:tripartite-type tricarboxylate transporter receptor subunit TctC
MKQLLSLLLTALTCALPAWAQTYPVKPVRVVVQTPPGGLQDALARAIAQDLAKLWNQGVVVENRPGAGGIAAAEAVARSAPDGYTVLQTDNISFLTNEFLRTAKLPYVLEKDFEAVSVLVSAKNIAVGSPKLPASNMQQLVALAKQRAGTSAGPLNYGSFGIGSIVHIDVEALAHDSGVQFNHVPYKGGAPVVQAVLTNEVDFAMMGMTAAIPLIRQGRIKALAYGGLARSSVFPDLPTLSESGFKGFDSGAWFCWLVPAGTPRAVVEKIGADTGRVITAPEFRDKHVTGVGHELVNAQGGKLWEMLAQDRKVFAARVKPLNLKLD